MNRCRYLNYFCAFSILYPPHTHPLFSFVSPLLTNRPACTRRRRMHVHRYGANYQDPPSPRTGEFRLSRRCLQKGDEKRGWLSDRAGGPPSIDVHDVHVSFPLLLRPQSQARGWKLNKSTIVEDKGDQLRSMEYITDRERERERESNALIPKRGKADGGQPAQKKKKLLCVYPPAVMYGMALIHLTGEKGRQERRCD